MDRPRVGNRKTLVNRLGKALEARSFSGMHTWIVHAWEAFDGWTGVVSKTIFPSPSLVFPFMFDKIICKKLCIFCLNPQAYISELKCDFLSNNVIIVKILRSYQNYQSPFHINLKTLKTCAVKSRLCCDLSLLYNFKQRVQVLF